MILQFEWTGRDTASSGYAYKLQTPLNCRKLVLKSVAVYGTSSLDSLTPLYLNCDFLGQQSSALFVPATYSDGSGRVNDVHNQRIAIGTVNDLGSAQTLNLTLMEGETHLPHGQQLAFSLDHRPITGSPFRYSDITALAGADFPDNLRVVITLECTGGSQAPESEA